MINVLDPEKLAALAAISLEQAAADTPPAFSRPIVIDEEGYAYGVCPDDETASSYLHAGLRLGWAPMPLQNGLLVSLWGGLQPDPGFEEEGVTAFFTRGGLRRLAADLLAIADASEPV